MNLSGNASTWASDSSNVENKEKSKSGTSKKPISVKTETKKLEELYIKLSAKYEERPNKNLSDSLTALSLTISSLKLI